MVLSSLDNFIYVKYVFIWLPVIVSGSGVGRTREHEHEHEHDTYRLYEYIYQTMSFVNIADSEFIEAQIGRMAYFDLG